MSIHKDSPTKKEDLLLRMYLHSNNLINVLLSNIYHQDGNVQKLNESMDMLNAAFTQYQTLKYGNDNHLA